MELGMRLKQARLEAGLSQRQLCGDVITRNMLSQIENGSARPSMETLRYLAAQLERPVSYFLDEEQSVPHNQTVLTRARQAEGERVLELLETYQAPDPVFDPERYLLEVLTCLELAEEAIKEGKMGYGLRLLDRARQAGEKTPYYTQELQRRKLLLRFAAGADARSAAMGLPALEPELLLRAKAALDSGDPEGAAAFLDSAKLREGQWYFLRGQVWEEQGSYPEAIGCYLQAETWSAQQSYACLERCYKALGDYKNAYEYACKQR